ncbi:7604_t:CDS:1, partial [Dentiscutata heterogama]
GWLPLAPFRNYSQWSNGTMSMELVGFHWLHSEIILNGAMEQCQ